MPCPEEKKTSQSKEKGRKEYMSAHMFPGQVLMQQRDLVDAQIERLHAHMEQQSSSAAADATPSASPAPVPPLNGLSNGTSSGGGTAASSPASGAAGVAGGNAQAAPEAAAVPGPSAPPSGAKATPPEQGSASVRHHILHSFCFFLVSGYHYVNERM